MPYIDRRILFLYGKGYSLETNWNCSLSWVTPIFHAPFTTSRHSRQWCLSPLLLSVKTVFYRHSLNWLIILYKLNRAFLSAFQGEIGTSRVHFSFLIRWTSIIQNIIFKNSYCRFFYLNRLISWWWQYMTDGWHSENGRTGDDQYWSNSLQVLRQACIMDLVRPVSASYFHPLFSFCSNRVDCAKRTGPGNQQTVCIAASHDFTHWKHPVLLVRRIIDVF